LVELSPLAAQRRPVLYRSFRIAILIGSLVSIAAAETRFVRPVLGRVFDQSAGCVRWIEGVPGAASVGDVEGCGLAVERVSLAPSGRLTAVVSQSGALLVTDGAGRTASLSDEGFEGALLWSPDGVRLGAAAGEFTVFSDFFAEAPVSSVSLPLPEGSRVLAISDGGSALLKAGGAVILQSASGGLPVAHGEFTAGAFRTASSGAALADSDGNLWLMSDAPAGVVLTTFGREPVKGVTALAFTADGGYLLAVAGEGRRLVRIDTLSGATSEVPLPFRAAGLFRLNSNAVFAFQDSIKGAFPAVDAGRETLEIFTIAGGRE
jgi:hypothetical protein